MPLRNDAHLPSFLHSWKIALHLSLRRVRLLMMTKVHLSTRFLRPKRTMTFSNALNFRDMDDDTSPHPLDFQALATAQNQDNKLLQELQADPQHYARVLMDHNVQLICYMP